MRRHIWWQINPVSRAVCRTTPVVVAVFAEFTPGMVAVKAVHHAAFAPAMVLFSLINDHRLGFSAFEFLDFVTLHRRYQPLKVVRTSCGARFWNIKPAATLKDE